MGGRDVRCGRWLVAAVFAACSAPPGAGAPDATTADAGATIDAAADGDASLAAADAAPDDAGTPDAGSPDSGIVCQPVDDCHAAGVFLPEIGRCSEPPLDDDTPCDDRSICTSLDVCLAGKCTGGFELDPPGELCDDGVCFTDIAPTSGLTFASTALMTSFMSAAGVLLDYDGDGLLDVLLGSESATPKLYRNEGDGTFTDVTSAAGLPVVLSAERFMGLSAADYDNDGDTDVYVTFRGPNRLWRNNGDGTFTDATTLAGVGDPRWSMSAAFGDYDRDGLLDLYVANYIDEKMFPFHEPQPNTLYRNRGDGTFEDVTVALGVGGVGTTLAVTWTDYDADGQLDLIACNDFGAFIEPNRVYHADGGAFTEVSDALGADIELFCMGIAPGDFDRDGDLDYYFTNLGRNALLRNDGATFTDVTDATGTLQTFDRCSSELFITSWSAGFADFDNDGWVDLYVSNGHVPAAPAIANSKKTANALYRHDGAALTFSEISHTAGVDDGRVGRAAAFGDVDRDGDVDILQVNADGQVALYRNDSTATGASIVIDARGRVSNRDGLGARVVVTTAEATLVREVTRTFGYLMASDPAVHVGVGAATEATVDVAWPSGIGQRLLFVPAGTRVAAVEPRAPLATATPDATTVAAGATASMTVQLDNHTGADVTVSVRLAVRADDAVIATGAATDVLVPAAGSAMTVATVAIPAGASGPALLVVTGSESGAIDQRAAAITLTP